MYLTDKFITVTAIFLAVFLIGAAINTRSMLVNAAIEPICPTGTTYDSSSQLCVDGSACPQDSTFQNGQCQKSTLPTCPPDTVGPDAQGQCTKTTKTNACPPDTIFENGYCKTTTSTPATCASGYTGPDAQGQCTKTSTTAATCLEGYTGPDAQGQCTKTTITGPVCPAGSTGPDAQGQCTTITTYFGTCAQGGGSQGLCVSPVGFVSGPADCPAGTTYDPPSHLCSYGPVICDKGGTLIPGHSTCVITTKTPATCTQGTLQGTECVSTSTTQATCPQGYTLQGVECISKDTTDACPLGASFQNGQCISTAKTPAICPADATGPDSQGQCTSTTTTPATCPQDSTFNNGNCVTVTQINCPTDTAPDSTGTCVASATCATAPGPAGPGGSTGGILGCCPALDPTCRPEPPKKTLTTQEEIDKATDHALNPNKLNHYFEDYIKNPKLRQHHLDPLLKELGWDGVEGSASRLTAEQTFVKNYVIEAINSGKLPIEGEFKIPIDVGDGTLIIQGAMSEGFPKISDFYMAGTTFPIPK